MSKTFEEYAYAADPGAMPNSPSPHVTRRREDYEAGQASRDDEVAELVAAVEFFSELSAMWRGKPLADCQRDPYWVKHSATLAKHAKGKRNGQD